MDVDVVGDEEASTKHDTDADESKKKVVYILMHLRRNAELKVISLDPHKDSGDRFTDKTGMFEKGKPSGLDELFFYTIAALGSRMYFIGGKHRVGLMASDRVFAFDTHSEEWVPSVARLNRKRYLSVVVTYENKIYSFGNANDYEWDFLPEHYAEVYHSSSDTWEYLPGDPPEELVKGHRNLIPALVKHKKIIFLCIRYFGVYGYSLDGNCWSSHISDPNFFGFGTRWNDTVAVLNNTLYWECFGCIFAYDFQPETDASVKTYTLPNALEKFGTPSPYDTLHVSTALVNAGNGKLCLVYGSQCGPDDDDDMVCCHTFEFVEKFKPHKVHNDIYNCLPPSIVVSVVAIEENRERSVMETFAEATQKCKACGNIVSLVDQHTVDNNVYHKACFRSHHSKSTLKVDNRVSDMFCGTQEKCVVCKKTAYPTETVVIDGTSYHKRCFRCIHGRCTLNVSNYVTHEHKLYCRPHYSQLFREKGNFNQLSEHSKVAIENTSD